MNISYQINNFLPEGNRSYKFDVTRSSDKYWEMLKSQYSGTKYWKKDMYEIIKDLKKHE